MSDWPPLPPASETESQLLAATTAGNHAEVERLQNKLADEIIAARRPRFPVVGDKVSYSMLRKMYSPVEAIVTATSAEDSSLSGMQIRVLIYGKKNQHPTGAIDYSEKPTQCTWCWPGDRDRWLVRGQREGANRGRR